MCHAWGTGEVHTGFWWGNLMEKDHLEELRVNGRTILKWICNKWDGDMDWIVLDYDSDMWRAFVNAVMSFQVT
jgi:hypothetical protein